ncbi:hypothetical protein P3W85_03780, partial [Cupriavidus basilensis]
ECKDQADQHIGGSLHVEGEGDGADGGLHIDLGRLDRDQRAAGVAGGSGSGRRIRINRTWQRCVHMQAVEFGSSEMAVQKRGEELHCEQQYQQRSPAEGGAVCAKHGAIVAENTALAHLACGP